MGGMCFLVVFTLQSMLNCVWAGKWAAVFAVYTERYVRVFPLFVVYVCVSYSLQCCSFHPVARSNNLGLV